MRWYTTVGLILLATLVLLAGAVIMVVTTDPNKYRSLIEETITDATGREFSIGGAFDIEFSMNPSVLAEDITFANPDWSEQPAMVQVDRFFVRVNLWSVVLGPILIRDLQLEGAEVLLEVDSEFRANWELELPGPEAEGEEEFDPTQIVVENLEVRNVELIYNGPSMDQQLTVAVDHLSLHPVESGLLHAELVGAANGHPIDIKGEIGPLANLLDGRNVTGNISGLLGEAKVSFQGTLSDPATLGGPDIVLDVSGTDLQAFTDAWVLPDLGSGPFQIQASATESSRGVDLRVVVDLGDVQATLEGYTAALLEPDPMEFAVSATGADLAALRDVLLIDGLPVADFEISGVVRHRNQKFEFDNVIVRVGDNQLELGGVLGDPPEFVGTDAEFSLTSPDLSAFSDLTGMPLAAQPFLAEGRITWTGVGLELGGVTASIGDNRVNLEGIVGAPPELEGTDVQIHARGPDASAIPALARYGDVPAEPFNVNGRVRVVSQVYEIEDVAVNLGDVQLAVTGTVGQAPTWEGTDLTFETEGPDLSDLSHYIGVKLPAETFAISGRIEADQGKLLLHGVSARLGPNQAEIEGAIAVTEDLRGSDLRISASGPTLGILAPYFANVELPEAGFSVSGNLRIRETGYGLEQVVAKLGDVTLKADGAVGQFPDLHGTDLNFDAKGPDFTVLAELFGIPGPPAPFHFRGRVERLPAGLSFHELVAEIGPSRLDVNGVLGEPPTLDGTDLDFTIAGPDLGLVAAFAGIEEFPEDPFEISGHFGGTPEQFTLQDFVARLGSSDLAGSFQMDLRAKPSLTGKFRSDYLDVSSLLERPDDKDSVHLTLTEDLPVDVPPAADKSQTFLIPNEPLKLDALNTLNADLRFTADELILVDKPVHDFVLNFSLHDGHLRIDPISLRGANEGELTGALSLDPISEGFRVTAKLNGDDVRLGLVATEGEAPRDNPPWDIDLNVGGQGRSLHEIAAVSNGQVQLTQGEGRISNSALEAVTADVLFEIFGALNPFAKKEPYTELQCSILVFDIVDGKATLDPFVVRTNKMTMLGKGSIDLETEKFDLNWTTKPRKGIGLSASAVTNSYIKLGGTLSNPTLGVKPLEAVATTGVAVATAGLSILAKGLADRMTAEIDVCTQTLEDLGKTEERPEAQQ